MATQAEAIRVTVPPRKLPRNIGKALVQGLSRWGQRGQLGSSLEMARYTGARV